MENKTLRKILLAIVVIILVVCSFGGGLVFGRFAPTLLPALQTKTFAPFWEAWTIVHRDYVDQPVNNTQLMQGAISGMLQSLGDPHTLYLSPENYQAANSFLKGSYAGIGTLVDTSGKLLTITKPFPDSPAEKAGLQAGDQIIAVDGKDVTYLVPEAVHQMVLGPEGTIVELTIQRPGQETPIDFTIKRAIITVPSVTSKMLDNNIAYIQISTFGDNTAADLHKHLGDLMAKKPKGLILDLRNNGGGILETGIQVASEFISSGVIVTEKSGNGTLTSHDALPGGLATDKSLPMIVLVNGYSASASEIVAGALQDTGRAKLLGETTYGKGTAQYWIPLSYGSGAVTVTIARWLTPNGRTIDRKGLTPDLLIKLTTDDIKANHDPQLDAAVQQLTNAQSV